mmetsp:Transcript_104147/g.335827  ORF Transcript_104147/g.335827 Transcript_104147/m.335827 type:complete len:256 (+) Transcript_104147:523-1290(+)
MLSLRVSSRMLTFSTRSMSPPFVSGSSAAHGTSSFCCGATLPVAPGLAPPCCFLTSETPQTASWAAQAGCFAPAGSEGWSCGEHHTDVCALYSASVSCGSASSGASTKCCGCEAPWPASGLFVPGATQATWLQGAPSPALVGAGTGRHCSIGSVPSCPCAAAQGSHAARAANSWCCRCRILSRSATEWSVACTCSQKTSLAALSAANSGDVLSSSARTFPRLAWAALAPRLRSAGRGGATAVPAAGPASGSGPRM